MSFSQVLSDSVNKVIETYISKVSSQFNISKEDLLKLWNGEKVSTSATTKAQESTVAPLPLSPELANLSYKELVAQCKSRGLKAVGNKEQLLERLTGGANASANVSSSESKVSESNATESKPKSRSSSSKKTKTKKDAEEPVQKPVIKSVQATIKPMEIKKNKFGNFENPETGFIFDRASREVIGKQGADGKVLPLEESDIETCNKFKFKYVLPDNLNSKDKKVVIEDMEEEDVADEEEVLEEEEEEVIEEEELMDE